MSSSKPSFSDYFDDQRETLETSYTKKASDTFATLIKENLKDPKLNQTLMFGTSFDGSSSESGTFVNTYMVVRNLAKTLIEKAAVFQFDQTLADFNTSAIKQSGDAIKDKVGGDDPLLQGPKGSLAVASFTAISTVIQQLMANDDNSYTEAYSFDSVGPGIGLFVYAAGGIKTVTKEDAEDSGKIRIFMSKYQLVFNPVLLSDEAEIITLENLANQMIDAQQHAKEISDTIEKALLEEIKTGKENKFVAQGQKFVQQYKNDAKNSFNQLQEEIKKLTEKNTETS